MRTPEKGPGARRSSETRSTPPFDAHVHMHTSYLMLSRIGFACFLFVFVTAGYSPGEESSRDASSGGQAETNRSELRPDFTAADRDSLRGTILSTDDTLGTLHAVEVVGPYLVAADFSYPSPHVLQRSDGSYVGRLGKRGEGPGEFQGTWSIYAESGSPPVVWAYDLQNLRMTRIHIDSMRATDAYEPRMINFSVGFSPTTPRVIGDSVVVTPGFLLEPGRLAYLTPGTGSLKEVVGPPYPNPDDVPQGVLQHAYQSYMTQHPNRSRVALAFRYTDRLEILRPDGELLQVARGPDRTDPIFEVGSMQGEPARASTPETLSAYIAISATTDRLYLLYVGTTRGESRRDHAREVHVFDWDGRLKRVYDLEYTASGLSVSPDGTALYASRQAPSPAIVQYDLPPRPENP